MIQPINVRVDMQLIEKMSQYITSGDSNKIAINEPTGDFFYDPWRIKKEFIGSPFEEALSSLPDDIGEARIITLESGRCYFSHSDIDDRYHLNLTGDCAALIDLSNNKNYFLDLDGMWYLMNAGCLHSAANYGQYPRKQLVVRQRLSQCKLANPLSVKITLAGNNARFVFDNSISPWLNKANKNKTMSNFKVDSSSVYFKIEKTIIQDLEKIIPKEFKYDIEY
jgi:hypothetical protein